LKWLQNNGREATVRHERVPSAEVTWTRTTVLTQIVANRAIIDALNVQKKPKNAAF
jgi:hypothetical protein